MRLRCLLLCACVFLVACGGQHSHAPNTSQAARTETTAVASARPVAPSTPAPAVTAAVVSPPTAAAAVVPAAHARAPAATQSLTGQVLITREDGLVRRDLGSGKETRLFAAPSGRFITFPAWSPDGRRFAYILTQPYQPSG